MTVRNISLFFGAIVLVSVSVAYCSCEKDECHNVQYHGPAGNDWCKRWGPDNGAIKQAVNLRSLNPFGTFEPTSDEIRLRDYNRACDECQCQGAGSLKKCNGVTGNPTEDKMVQRNRCDIFT